MINRILSTTFLIVLLSATSVFAQKQKLEPKDYGQWQRINNTQLSPNGNWFAYNITLWTVTDGL